MAQRTIAETLDQFVLMRFVNADRLYVMEWVRLPGDPRGVPKRGLIGNDEIDWIQHGCVWLKNSHMETAYVRWRRVSQIFKPQHKIILATDATSVTNPDGTRCQEVPEDHRERWVNYVKKHSAMRWVLTFK